MKINIGRILFLFLISISLWRLFADRSLFTIEEVKVVIEMPENDREAWKALNQEVADLLKVYKGRSLWGVSLREVNSKLIRYPLLQNLQIQKEWPQRLHVTYELPPLMVIRSIGNAHFSVLTKKGEWLGPLVWSKLPNLPWVRGEWLQKREGMTEKLLLMLGQLPDTGPLSPSKISEINFNDADGFLLTLVKSGQQIRFGFDDFEIKALRIGQVLDYLQTRSLESRVIDANFSKKVLVRLRNHP